MVTVQVRRATEADVDALAPMLARAFIDEEFIDWVLPDRATRPERAARLFTISLRLLALRNNFEVYTTDDLAGSAIWAPPGSWNVGVRMALPAAVPTIRCLGPRGIQRLLRSGAALDRCHPHEPHWYLSTLGTDPSRQGQGIGGQLLAPVLARCDEEGIGAYLETMSLGNVAFYRGKGFDVRKQVHLPGGGPPCWTMWRPPRPPE